MVTATGVTLHRLRLSVALDVCICQSMQTRNCFCVYCYWSVFVLLLLDIECQPGSPASKPGWVNNVGVIVNDIITVCSYTR